MRLLVIWVQVGKPRRSTEAEIGIACKPRLVGQSYQNLPNFCVDRHAKRSRPVLIHKFRKELASDHLD